MSGEEELQGDQPWVFIGTSSGIGPPLPMYVFPRGKTGSDTTTSLPFDSGYDQGNIYDASVAAP